MIGDEGDDAELVRLVSIALESQAAGVRPCVDSLCADRPGLRAPLRELLDVADRVSLTTLQRAHLEHVGQTLAGRYRCEAVIGVGSMGIVYRACDLELRRLVAVKVPAPVQRDERGRARFAREVELLAAVRHHSVVAYLDRGPLPAGGSFLVTELLDGAPMSSFVVAGRRPRPADAIAWVAGLAEAAQAVHDCGVAHGDINPNNGFVTVDDRPVLLDFGVAARVGDEVSSPIENLGTAANLAPELLEQRRPSARADVYALAATLYHLATGAAPYTGSPKVVRERLRAAPPPPPRRVCREVLAEVAAIVEWGMARHLPHRCGSANEFAAALRALRLPSA